MRLPLLATSAVALAASAPWHPTTVPAAPHPARPDAGAADSAESRDPRVPLSPAAQRWVDSTLATLTPRARAAQLIHVWLLGDYESASDSAFAQTARWVREDGIGGILMSVGSPIEVAAKLNALGIYFGHSFFQLLARGVA